MTTWDAGSRPEYPPLGAGRVIVGLIFGFCLLTVLLLGVVATLAVRIVEAPIFGRLRPWSGWITVIVCRAALVCLRLPRESRGAPMREHGILVANHSSWLDIFVLNASAPLYFVSKAEVAGWPGIGWLARLTGTVFVRRDAREAGRQAAMLEDRITAGHRLLFFPEGTSTDGQRVLPFKPTLFAAVFSERLAGKVSVQPVTVAYTAPEGCDPRFFGWWGDMDFGPHLLRVLAGGRGGAVTVTWHDPIPVGDHANRKSLARTAEAAVRSDHPNGGEGAA